MKTFIAAMLLACATTLPAQADTPSYASSQSSGDQQIRGRIVSFNGRYDVSVRDERGHADRVLLHEGTIINPSGLTLQPGMVVCVLGYSAGQDFLANEVDTPYNFYGGVPYYLDHPWTYYGPSVGLGFFFDSGPAWYHRSVFRGPYRWGPTPGGRIYSHFDPRPIYGPHGGGFHGRQYVAPHVGGGYHAPHGPPAGGHIHRA